MFKLLILYTAKQWPSVLWPEIDIDEYRETDYSSPKLMRTFISFILDVPTQKLRSCPNWDLIKNQNQIGFVVEIHKQA